MNKILVWVFLLITGFFIVGCSSKNEEKAVWQGVFYEHGEESSETYGPVFDNFDACKAWVSGKKKYDDDLFTCNKNCHDSLADGTPICELVIRNWILFPGSDTFINYTEGKTTNSLFDMNLMVNTEKKESVENVQGEDTSNIIIKEEKDLFGYGVFQGEYFSLYYPQNWTQEEKAYGTEVAVLSPLIGKNDNFSENCNVVLDTEASNYSSLNYFNESVSQLPDYITNFVEISRGNFETKDNVFYYVTYVGESDGFDLYWAQYLTKGKSGNHYILTCTAAFENYIIYKNTFDDMAINFLVK